MAWKKSIIASLVLLLVATSATIIVSGCSKKIEEEERAAISKSETESDAETRKIPTATKAEIKYSNDTGKIKTLADKLNANKTPETAKAVEAEIKKPAAFVAEYVQDNPQTPEGATALKLIASTYITIDGLIGNQQKDIARVYKLLVKIYPDSPHAAEANEWLKAHP